MIDTATQAVEQAPAPQPAVAPAAPAQETPAAQPAQAEPQVTQPTKPQPVRNAYNQAAASAAERAKEMAKRFMQPRTEAVVDEHGRKHDQATGQYLPDGTEAPADEEGTTPAVAESGDKPTTEPAAAEERQAEAIPEDKAAVERPQTVRVDLPDALKEQGRTHLTVPAEEQELARALANGYVRRAQLDELRQQLNDERTKRLQLESGLSAQDKIRQTPEYQAKVEKYTKLKDLEEAGELPDGTASEYWRTSQEDLRKLANEEFQQRMQQVEQADVAEAAKVWIADAWQRTQALPPQVRELPHFNEIFNRTVAAFDFEVSQGYHPEIKDDDTAHEAFRKFFGARLLAEPGVRQAFDAIRQREAERNSANTNQAERDRKLREQAEREGAEKLRRQMAETRQNTPPNPMGKVAHQDSGVSPSTLGEPDANASISNMSPIRAERYLADRAAQRARERFRRT